MSLEVKKIYVDSRYCTADSVDDNDFKIQLARNIYLPEKCVMHIENIVMSHSWYTIEAGINDCMYVKYGSTCFVATIPSTNYTGASLAAAVANVLGRGFAVTYDLNTNTLKLINSQTFKILTDAELATGLNNTWTGPTYNLSSPNSCNDIITNRKTNSQVGGAPFVSGMLNLNGFRAVYISSSTISNYNTLGAKGETNIIKKIPVNADFGYICIDQHVSDHDFLPVERMTLQTIDFQVKDVKGNLIPFHGSPISFTIVFSLQDKYKFHGNSMESSMENYFLLKSI